MQDITRHVASNPLARYVAFASVAIICGTTWVAIKLSLVLRFNTDGTRAPTPRAGIWPPRTPPGRSGSEWLGAARAEPWTIAANEVG